MHIMHEPRSGSVNIVHKHAFVTNYITQDRFQLNNSDTCFAFFLLFLLNKHPHNEESKTIKLLQETVNNSVQY